MVTEKIFVEEDINSYFYYFFKIELASSSLKEIKRR